MGLLEKTVDALGRYCTASSDAERMAVQKTIRELMQLREENAHSFRKDLDTVIRDTLLEIGVPDKLLGHRYLVTALTLTVNNPKATGDLTKKLYPAVAEQHDTTWSRAERAMRHAIEAAWDRGDMDTLQRYFGYTVQSLKGKPTNGEFIARIANVVRKKMQEGQ